MVDIDKGVREFAAQALRLTGLTGIVNVTPVAGLEAMRVRFDGDPAQIAQIQCEVIDRVLRITGAPAAGMVVNMNGGVTNVVSGNSRATMVIGNVYGGIVNFGSGTIIGGNNYGPIVNGRPMPGMPASIPSVSLTTTVEVPRHRAVTVCDTQGAVYCIGDIVAAVSLQFDGSAHATVGRVTGAVAKIGGGGQIDIAEIQDSRCRCEISGSGTITIRGGSADQFDAVITGSGEIGFKGVARRATMNIAGSGDIRIDQVTEHVQRNVTGSGNCSVRVMPDTSPDAFWGF